MLQRDQFIDATVAACQEIFDMILPLKMTPAMSQRPLPFEIAVPIQYGDVIATIGLTGQYSGTISLYLPMKISLNLAGWLMEENYSELNGEVLESIGEMINMIAGGIKNRLSSAEDDIFDISLPIVIAGEDKKIFWGKDKEHIIVPIDTDQGMFLVSLVLDRN